MTAHRIGLVVLLAALSTSAEAQRVLFSFSGDNLGDQFGFAVATAGDVNLDGLPDILIGAPNGTQCPGGYARVFSGRDGSLLYTFHGDCDDPNIQGDSFGYSVSTAGDVDRDGRPDIIVGAPLDDLAGGDTGSAKVFSGKSGALLYTLTGLFGDMALYGKRVTGGGELDGDLASDVLVSAPAENLDAPGGAVYVISGRNGLTIGKLAGVDNFSGFGMGLCLLKDVTGDAVVEIVVGEVNNGQPGKVTVFSGKDLKPLFVVDGYANSDRFGACVSDVGDIDQDGLDDLIIGSADLDPASAGRATVVSGRDGSVIDTFVGEAPKDQFGRFVAGVGDVNGDGMPDMLVGTFSPDGRPGYARLFSGRTGALLYRFEGTRSDDYFGSSGNGLGDLDGDGLADLIIGDQSARINGVSVGAAYVFAGSDVYLNAYPRRNLDAGDSVSVTMRERQPGEPCLLALTAIGGTLTFAPLVTGVIDPTGTFTVNGVVPSGWSATTFTLRSFVLDASGLIHDSEDEVVRIK